MGRQLAAGICVSGWLLTMAGGSVASGQADARRTANPVCGSRDSHTVVARDTQAEVYRVHQDESEVYEYWGCAYGSTKTFRLGAELVSGSPYGSLSVEHVTLAGTTVAFETEQSSTAGNREGIKSDWYVVVASLRTRRVLHKVPTGVRYPPRQNFVGDGPVAAIVVKSDGAVAWILDTVQPEDRYQVHALDATGERVLAVGSNIAANSLALAGSTLYWIQGGQPFSAALD